MLNYVIDQNPIIALGTLVNKLEVHECRICVWLVGRYCAAASPLLQASQINRSVKNDMKGLQVLFVSWNIN